MEMTMECMTSKLRAAALTIFLLVAAGLPACVSVDAAPQPVSMGDSRASAGVLARAFTAGSRTWSGATSTTGRFAVYVLDSGVAPDAGFLVQPDRLTQSNRARHPFQRVWVAPDHDRAKYQRIVISPVVVDHMLENSWWDNLSTATLFDQEGHAQYLAGRLRISVEQAFREDPNQRFVVLESPDDQTLILELALVELVPNKSIMALGALASMAAPPYISAPIGFAVSRAEHGYVAIEGRVRDASTGKVVAMFTDRESAKGRVLDLQSLRWYGHAYEIFDEWAEQLVAVANRPADPGVRDPTPFTLTPW
jgi:hypothetical protein